MPSDHILNLLIAERDKLTRAIEVLQGAPRRGGRPRKDAMPTIGATPATNHSRKRPRWTAAQRKAAGERSKAMWAKRRKTAKKG